MYTYILVCPLEGEGVFLNEYTLISDILKQAKWEEGKLYIVNYGTFM